MCFYLRGEAGGRRGTADEPNEFDPVHRPGLLLEGYTNSRGVQPGVSSMMYVTGSGIRRLYASSGGDKKKAISSTAGRPPVWRYDGLLPPPIYFSPHWEVTDEARRQASPVGKRQVWSGLASTAPAWSRRSGENGAGCINAGAR